MATVCQPVDGDPEFVCQFSQYPGTVGWKSGFRALKDALIGETFPDVLPEDDHPCDTPGHPAYADIGPGGACERVFGRSRKDMFRYVFSAHALGVPKDHCLVTDPNDPNFGLSDPVCQMGDSFHEPNTFTGVGDFGGGDAMMTMCGFLNALGQPVGTDNQQAGTLMHELGHTMLLRHGGAPQNANCAPNYLSVMNYLFQLRGLVGGVTIDYSGQTIGDLDEGSLSEIAGLSGLMPGDPTEPMGSPPYGTAWYAPFRGIGTQATRHCNGTPLSLAEEAMLAAGNGMVRVEGTDVGSGIDWDGSGDATATPNLDINFDGVINDGFPDPPNEAPESLLAGFNDWANLRLNQVGSRRNIGVYFLAGDYPYVGPASLDLGRLDFGRLDFGRLDFGRLDFGRLDFGDMNIGDLGRLDFGRLDFGDFSPVDFDFGRLDFGVGAGDLGRGADGKGGGFGRLDFGRLDFGGGGEGGADAELTTVLAVAAGLLDPPTGLTAVEQTGPLGVLLNWEAPDARVTAYVVYREEGEKGEVTFTPGSAVGTVVRDANNVLATTFLDPNVVPGTTYTYYVAAQYVEGLEVNESASDTVTLDVSAPDITPPVIAPHSDVSAEATGPGGASVSYDLPVTADDVDPAGFATCAPLSDSVFAVGDTTVTCTATDVAGNDAIPTTFTVSVVDTTLPVIAPHGDESAEATGAAGATVGYDLPGTTDIVDPAGFATCAPLSDSVFAVGDTTVTCTATDAAGNDAIPTAFTVSVVDTTLPVIAPHGDESAEATGPAGATVSYDLPGTTDIVDPAGFATCAPLSDSVFAVGDTTVTCTATDVAGNDAIPTTFTVSVVDTTLPVIAPHGDESAEATGAAGATVGYDLPGTTDIVDPAGFATCAPLSDSVFAVGDTTVTCTATDVAGNDAIPTTFTVSVVDTIAPDLTLPADITADATGPTGAVVNYEASATDAVDPLPTFSCVPASGSTFPLGVTGVTCTATDSGGNSADGAFNVTVVDTSAPVVTVSTDPTQLWPPNGRIIRVTVFGTVTDAISGVDPNGVSYALSDEYGVFDSSGAVILNVDPGTGIGSYSFTVDLEASRNGGDTVDGRVYTITVTASDNSGTSAFSDSTTINVHDQSK